MTTQASVTFVSTHMHTHTHSRTPICITCRVQETASDLAAMIGVFNKLPTLFGTGDEDADDDEEEDKARPPSLLDEDCKNSVLGVFVRQYLLEYKRLTFSQLVAFHSEWTHYVFPPSSSSDTSHHTTTGSNNPVEDAIGRRDFVSALKHLTLPDVATRRGRRDEGIGAEALALSSLHGRFGHL